MGTRELREITVKACEVRPGDRWSDGWLITGVVPGTGNGSVTDIQWEQERWIDNKGRQCPTFVGTRGQCFASNAELRVLRPAGPFADRKPVTDVVAGDVLVEADGFMWRVDAVARTARTASFDLTPVVPSMTARGTVRQSFSLRSTVRVAEG